MVFTDAHTVAGIVARTTLTYDDVTGFNTLAAEQFYA